VHSAVVSVDNVILWYLNLVANVRTVFARKLCDRPTGLILNAREPLPVSPERRLCATSLCDW
jgi:hypothetical protein